jgi:hypothetical protein
MELDLVTRAGAPTASQTFCNPAIPCQRGCDTKSHRSMTASPSFDAVVERQFTKPRARYPGRQFVNANKVILNPMHPSDEMHTQPHFPSIMPRACQKGPSDDRSIGSEAFRSHITCPRDAADRLF